MRTKASLKQTNKLSLLKSKRCTRYLHPTCGGRAPHTPQHNVSRQVHAAPPPPRNLQKKDFLKHLSPGRFFSFIILIDLCAFYLMTCFPVLEEEYLLFHVQLTILSKSHKKKTEICKCQPSINTHGVHSHAFHSMPKPPRRFHGGDCARIHLSMFRWYRSTLYF
ncbi:hypothetical protein EYF80_009151 [Liparis tanakae]|uniref:Uncharacterized protein n=1 Tax=Liparis tanakae TaxID=230148 RepID=A0A4Z2ITW9_9TELE|nr:hypothetical protein EYF80_009151 [Liparis tanakae]